VATGKEKIVAKRAHNQAPRATDKRPEQIIQNIDGIIDDEAWTVPAS